MAAIPDIDGNFLAVLAGYLIRGIIAAYSQTEEPIRAVLTPRGLQMLDWSGHTCLLQGGVDYAFRHLEFWFNTDLNALISNDPFKSLLAAQRVGNIKTEGPVYISHNRWDPLIPYQAARQTAADRAMVLGCPRGDRNSRQVITFSLERRPRQARHRAGEQPDRRGRRC